MSITAGPDDQDALELPVYPMNRELKTDLLGFALRVYSYIPFGCPTSICSNVVDNDILSI